MGVLENFLIEFLLTNFFFKLLAGSWDNVGLLLEPKQKKPVSRFVYKYYIFTKLVGDYINITKTTFDFNFDFFHNQAF